MTVLLFEPRFVLPIMDGHKLHSIRPFRKRPIRAGDGLSLRAWEGKPYRSKQYTIADVTCLAVMPIWIFPQSISVAATVSDQPTVFLWPNDRDAFARSDGFDNWEQMKTYRDFHYNLPFKGSLILWGVHPMLSHLAPPP